MQADVGIDAEGEEWYRLLSVPVNVAVAVLMTCTCCIMVIFSPRIRLFRLRSLPEGHRAAETPARLPGQLSPERVGGQAGGCGRHEHRSTGRKYMADVIFRSLLSTLLRPHICLCVDIGLCDHLDIFLGCSFLKLY
jgi:hypothetical protein